MHLRQRPRRDRVGSAKSASRVVPTLMSAAIAGAASGVFGSDDASATCFRTGGAAVVAWAFGTLSGASPPHSTMACDLAHVCDVVVSDAGGKPGHGLQVKALFNPPQGQLPPNLPFRLTETIDYPDAVTNGAGGACYPVNGTITAQVNSSSKLVLDFQGQACEMAAGRGEAIVDGHYIGDPASTGELADLDAIGAVDIKGPSGLADSATTLKASLTGQLLFDKLTTDSCVQ
jgi:hypothetical protein